MTVDELPAMFDAIMGRVTAASPPCAMSLAHTFERQLKNVTLVQYSHARGTLTPSPARVGPPALVSGALRASVMSRPGAAGVVSTAYSGPTIFYAPIQEEGHVMHARPGHYMSWVALGRRWYKKTVHVPKRPFMGQALAAVIANGSLSRNAADVFEATVWGQ